LINDIMKETGIRAFISLPNLFTFINATLGLFAIYFIILDNLILSSRIILLAIFFDSFDGFLARKKNIVAEFGKSFDSLSDIISFGVAPAFIFISSNHNSDVGILIGFTYVLCGLLRLSRFSILDTEEYIGLPITLGAIFVILIHLSNIPKYLGGILVILTSLLFISSFRLKRPTKKGNSLVMASILFVFVSLVPETMIGQLSILLLIVLPIIFIFYLFRYPQS